MKRIDFYFHLLNDDDDGLNGTYTKKKSKSKSNESKLAVKMDS